LNCQLSEKWTGAELRSHSCIRPGVRILADPAELQVNRAIFIKKNDPSIKLRVTMTDNIVDRLRNANTFSGGNPATNDRIEKNRCGPIAQIRGNKRCRRPASINRFTVFTRFPSAVVR